MHSRDGSYKRQGTVNLTVIFTLKHFYYRLLCLICLSTYIKITILDPKNKK